MVHARLAASGYLAFLLSRTWWAIPAFLLYGIIYSGGISIRHECIQGTPFGSVWLNETFYFICAAMEQIDIVETSWSHTTHHSYTIMTPIDPEIITRRPARIGSLILEIFCLRAGPIFFKNLVVHSLGTPTDFAKKYIPEEEYGRLFWMCRAVLAIYVGVIALAIVLRSWLPLLYFGLPRYFGGIRSDPGYFIRRPIPGETAGG